MPPQRNQRDRYYHGGYVYKKKTQLKDDRLLLHCIYRETIGCRALAHKDVNDVYTVKNDHTHSPDVETSEAVMLRRELSDNAKADPTATPRSLIDGIRAKATSGAVTTLLGTTKSLTQIVQKTRPVDSDVNDVNSHPMILTGKYQLTDRNTQHVLHDSMIGSPNLPRIIVFMSQELITLVGTCTVLHVDGTFRIAKSLLSQNTQLWMIYCKIPSGEVVYAAAALMADRTQSSYERVIDVLKGALPGTWAPSRIAADFELAPRNAWKSKYPNVEIDSCLFHYAQSMRSKSVEMKLDLSVTPDFITFNRCRFLPFLEAADVPAAFAEIQQTANPTMTGFLNYLSTYYVNGGANGQGPRYPINEWTITGRFGNARTNCTAEAYNSVFSKKIGPNGPKLGSRLVELLIQEESRVANALPAFYLNPHYRIGRPDCPHTKKRNDAIRRASLNVHALTGIRYLDYLSNMIGKYRK